MDIQPEEEDIVSSVRKLAEELRIEKRRCRALSTELAAAREALVSNAVRAEVEEERIVNKLSRRCGELAIEKANLAKEVEREEELISNTLQRKMLEMKKNIANIENQMEQEQECMVNKLTRQVSELQKENSKLEMQCEQNVLRAYQNTVSECAEILDVGARGGLKDAEKVFDSQKAQEYFDAINQAFVKLFILLKEASDD